MQKYARSIIKKQLIIDKTAKIVCIDDFVLKKRHSYGTIMIDAEMYHVRSRTL
ncbi:hypothetical protein GIR35_14720 [Enterococcus faecalis]|nr:hypothetical protein GIR35_14720 [Enterococcus faecalis]